jgi:hypothetical protein
MLGTVLVCKDIIELVTYKSVGTFVVEISEGAVFVYRECEERCFYTYFSAVLIC